MKLKLSMVFSVLFLMSLNAPVLASVVAIIDSGTDMLHKDIYPKAWVNPTEIANNQRDEDRNGYQDDVNGWNFAEGNNLLIDYKYLPYLTADVRKFFEVQSKALLGTATAEEIAWMRAKIEDAEFVKTLTTYGNFMHGTHVSGIAAKEADDAKILGIKLIPTEVALPGLGNKGDLGNDLGIVLIKAGLGQLAKQQMKLLQEIAVYIDGHKADIANGSFGTGYEQARMIVGVLFKALLQREPTEEEGHSLAVHFINTLVQEGAHMVQAAPNTLFVFAAGNDGTDNDKFPSSPTNIRSSNTLSVAATLGLGKLASFSNYGAKMVDVAAPGVAIESSVPGNQYLKVSGTSQAAPYVSNVAARIKDANKLLNATDIKSIILKTVDVKDFLKGKVLSEGVVNEKRAVRAAELSLNLPMHRALEQAHEEVQDQVSDLDKEIGPMGESVGDFVLPLPSPFKF
ncbi:MAG: S8 family serine peptidase [Bdellovibrio sp.]|nr:S8 family serine peptidase [Bdellovibrio sp.]